MKPLYERTGKRARWRPKLVSPQGLRLHRTSCLGHVGGWCPPVAPVGPYRNFRLVPSAALLGNISMGTRLEDDDGLLDIHLASTARQATITCGRDSIVLTPSADGVLTGTLRLTNVERWWPHTHGEPVLHQVRAIVDGQEVEFGRVGFRSIEVDRDADGEGFGLKVNGVPVFCRGALWTNADLIGLPGTREAYAPLIARARDANMNMLRVWGGGHPQPDVFYDLTPIIENRPNPGPAWSFMSSVTLKL
jgi:beta-mannosidase